MSQHRLTSLDMLRGIAALWMIQVHITNQILDPTLRTGPFFTALNVSNGFVAPAFLFCAGMGLWIALSRKTEDYLALGPALQRYVRRLAYILFWAFMLHVPMEAMQAYPMGSLESWLQFDVLHTIVGGSVACLGVFLWTRSVRGATVAFGVLALAMIAGAPLIATVDFRSTPAFVQALFDSTFSPFPLWPWMLYVVAGAAVAGIVVPRAHQSNMAWRLIGLGLVLTFGIMLRKEFGPAMSWDDQWWHRSPDVFLFRIGGILLLLGALMSMPQKWGNAKGWQYVQTMGAESLFMYISHLMIVYGSTGASIIAALSLEASEYSTVALAFVVVTGPLSVLAYGWRWVRKHHPHWAMRVLAVQCASMVAWLLTLLLS